MPGPCRPESSPRWVGLPGSSSGRVVPNRRHAGWDCLADARAVSSRIVARLGGIAWLLIGPCRPESSPRWVGLPGSSSGRVVPNRRHARLNRMRLGRIASPDGVAFVSIEGDLDDPSGMSVREIAEHPFGTPTFTGRSWPLADVRLLAPMLAGKVVCVGKNYADHIAEMSDLTGPAPADPVIFLKPNTAIIGPNVPIRLPANASPVHFEGELAAVIGRPCKDVPAARAAENILGYTIGNDVSARDQQKADGQWTRAKGHDTFCPVGPWIVTDVDPADLDLRTEVNGQVKQHSRTSLMIHVIGAIVEWISAVMTLLPGDLILTGTPAGVGPIEDGDTVSISVEGIGSLTNPVVRREES